MRANPDIAIWLLKNTAARLDGLQKELEEYKNDSRSDSFDLTGDNFATEVAIHRQMIEHVADILIAQDIYTILLPSQHKT